MRLFISALLVLAGLAIAHQAFADDFAVTTTAFLDQGLLPTMYTCDGKNVSPELAFANPPAKTKSFAVVMTDPEAPNGTFYHWVIYNIPAATTEIPEAATALPKGALIGLNSWNKSNYGGPCPPKGTAHNYIITVYALDNATSLPANAKAENVLAAIKGHVLKSTTLTAKYSRWDSTKQEASSAS
ncbi:MAG: YbhB/YbcL family Raf kinase inhibitor-like protein [Gammaproteobacteria bacterium]|nr:YbhB/YbcL family Raf kinase inhibitor-like protein [Gammaproteobacteria bacterium]